MTRPIRDEYIDSAHAEPGESGCIRPTIKPPDQPAHDADLDDAAACLWCLDRLLRGLVIVLAIATAVIIVWQLSSNHR